MLVPSKTIQRPCGATVAILLNAECFTNYLWQFTDKFLMGLKVERAFFIHRIFLSGYDCFPNRLVLNTILITRFNLFTCVKNTQEQSKEVDNQSNQMSTSTVPLFIE